MQDTNMTGTGSADQPLGKALAEEEEAEAKHNNKLQTRRQKAAKEVRMAAGC